MARPIHKLSDVQLRQSRMPEDAHSDGNGLYFRVSKGGAQSWVFVYVQKRRRREMGMGRYPNVVRRRTTKATEAHDQIARGLDPIAQKRRQAPPTLEELSEQYWGLRFDRHAAGSDQMALDGDATRWPPSSAAG